MQLPSKPAAPSVVLGHGGCSWKNQGPVACTEPVGGCSRERGQWGAFPFPSPQQTDVYQQARRFLEAVVCIESPKSAWSAAAQGPGARELQLCRVVWESSIFPQSRAKGSCPPHQAVPVPSASQHRHPLLQRGIARSSLFRGIRTYRSAYRVLPSSSADTLSFKLLV